MRLIKKIKITYKTKKITKEEEIVISITCDKCQKEYNADRFSEDFLEIQEFHSIRFIGGYASVFGDMEEIAVDICQYCLFKMIKDIL